MADEIEVCPASELTPEVVVGAGPWAVGNADGELFAVSRRCRHLYADLAGGTIDNDGCLTCPWHGAKYDVKTGRMVLGPQGVFAKIPGFGAALKMLTRVLPLRRGQVVLRDEVIYIQ
ncbi:MAG: Rieske (2Fe-2S) protein [Acidimicrobiia bacterium]